MRSMRGKIRWRRHRIREKFEEAWTMGWDTALTVSFTGSILISRDGSATVAVNHHQLRRVFQHPSALLGVVTMVCPLVEVRHRGSAFVSRYSTIRSHREESRALPSVRFSPRLASPRRPPTEAYREFRKQEIVQRDCYFDINKIRGFRLFYCGGGIFAWMMEILRCLDNSQGKES